MHRGFLGLSLLRTSQAAECCAFISGAVISRTRLGTISVTCSNAKKKFKRDQKRAQKQGSHSALPTAPTNHPPQRITPDSKGNVSIKRAKTYVQQRADRARPSYRQLPSAYRKTPQTEDDRLEAELERKAQALSRKQQKAVVTLTKFYGTLGCGSEPVVLVDAHNVLFALERAKNLTRAAARSERRRMRAALTAGEDPHQENMPQLDPAAHELSREAMQERLSMYSSSTQMRVVVVWDALGGANPVTTREKSHGIDIVYCGDSDADTFLIREASDLRAAGAAEVIVVTSDGYLRDSIGSAHVIQASALIRELDKTDEQMNRFMKEQHIQSLLPRGSVGEALNTNTFESLQALQQQLPSVPSRFGYIRQKPKQRP